MGPDDVIVRATKPGEKPHISIIKRQDKSKVRERGIKKGWLCTFYHPKYTTYRP